MTAAIAVVIMLVTSVVAVAAEPSVFSDIDDSVHRSDIEAVAAAGITTGCNPPANDRFCPDDIVTRGQMAAFLARALDLAPAGHEFTDISGHVFEADVAALAAAGVTKGCNPPANSEFCPDLVLTRGQMAAFLARALDLAPAGHEFTDISGHVFEADVAALAAAGVTKGCNPPSNSHFCPDQELTREQMATFLARSVLVDPDVGGITTSTSTSTTIAAGESTSTTVSATSTSTSTSTSTTSTSTPTSTTLVGVDPVLDAVGDQWVTAGASVGFEISASDANGDVDEIRKQSGPAWVTVADQGDGTATVTMHAPGSPPATPQMLTIVVEDERGGTDSETVEITVNPDTSGNTGPWQETNGLVLFDVEGSTPVPNWALADPVPNGALGTGVLQWTVEDQHGSPAVGHMQYQFEIVDGGTYRISARSRREGAGTSDEHNDMWLRVDGGAWHKFFQLGGKHKTWEWRHRQEIHVAGGDNIIGSWLEDFDPGVHTITIAGRSLQFQLDRIAVHTDHDVFPQNHFPESPRG